MASKKCFVHDVNEADTRTSVRCFECKHVYLTEADMVETWNNMIEELGTGPSSKAKSVSDIPFCPLCLHDF